MKMLFRSLAILFVAVMLAAACSSGGSEGGSSRVDADGTTEDGRPSAGDSSDPDSSDGSAAGPTAIGDQTDPDGGGSDSDSATDETDADGNPKSRKPAQGIRLNASSSTIYRKNSVVEYSFISKKFTAEDKVDPISVETGQEVRIGEVSGSCTKTERSSTALIDLGSKGNYFVSGFHGDVCVLSLIAPETDNYAETQIQITYRAVDQENRGWNVGQPSCRSGRFEIPVTVNNGAVGLDVRNIGGSSSVTLFVDGKTPQTSLVYRPVQVGFGDKDVGKRVKLTIDSDRSGLAVTRKSTSHTFTIGNCGKEANEGLDDTSDNTESDENQDELEPTTTTSASTTTVKVEE